MSISATQQQQAETFRDLHVRGKPLVLFNVWDAGSAKVVAAAGARAIATGSWSVAAAQGYGDGQELPLADALRNLSRIVASVALPVTIDLEAGYGDDPETVAASVGAAFRAGAIGINLEDQKIGGEGLYSIVEQALRVRAARAAAHQLQFEAFINARTDVFLKAPATDHNEALLEHALQRATAYAQAGASGIFVPGLVDEALILRFCANCPLPVNIMMSPSTPTPQRLAELGVSRISHGPGPYRLVMRALDEAARKLYG